MILILTLTTVIVNIIFLDRRRSLYDPNVTAIVTPQSSKRGLLLDVAVVGPQGLCLCMLLLWREDGLDVVLMEFLRAEVKELVSIMRMGGLLVGLLHEGVLGLLLLLLLLEVLLLTEEGF